MLHWNPAKRFTIHDVRQHLQHSITQNWLLRSRTELTGAPVHSAIARLLDDADMRRPRSPNGLADYVVFGSVDGFSNGEGSSTSESAYRDNYLHPRFTPSPPVSPGPLVKFGHNLLPPHRRTRYDSDMCDIEFSPYVNTDELLVVHQTWDSSTEDDYDDDDDNNGGSWVNAGKMSFSHLPKFEPAVPSGVGMPSLDVLSLSMANGASGIRPRFTFGGDNEDADSNEWDEEEEEDMDALPQIHLLRTPGHVELQPTDSGIDTARSWVDMDREMSFSVLPDFSELTITETENDNTSQDSGLDHEEELNTNPSLSHVSTPTPLSLQNNGMPTVLRTGSAPSSRPPSVIGLPTTNVSS